MIYKYTASILIPIKTYTKIIMLDYYSLYNVLITMNKHPKTLLNLSTLSKNIYNDIMEDRDRLLWNWLTDHAEYPSKHINDWIKVASIFCQTRDYKGNLIQCKTYVYEKKNDILSGYNDGDILQYITYGHQQYLLKNNVLYREQLLYPSMDSLKPTRCTNTDIILTIISNEFTDDIWDKQDYSIEATSTLSNTSISPIIYDKLIQNNIGCLEYMLNNGIITSYDICSENVIKHLFNTWIRVPESLCYIIRTTGSISHNIRLSDIMRYIPDNLHQELDYVLSILQDVDMNLESLCHYKFNIDIYNYRHILKEYNIDQHEIVDYDNHKDFVNLYLDGHTDLCKWMLDNIYGFGQGCNHQLILDEDLFCDTERYILEILIYRDNIPEYLDILYQERELYYIRWIMSNDIIPKYLPKLTIEQCRYALEKTFITTDVPLYKSFLEYMRDCIRNYIESMRLIVN